MLNELELKETALVSAAFVAREEKRGKGGEGEWREMWVGRMDGGQVTAVNLHILSKDTSL